MPGPELIKYPQSSLYMMSHPSPQDGDGPFHILNMWCDVQGMTFLLLVWSLSLLYGFGVCPPQVPWGPAPSEPSVCLQTHSWPMNLSIAHAHLGYVCPGGLVECPCLTHRLSPGPTQLSLGVRVSKLFPVSRHVTCQDCEQGQLWLLCDSPVCLYVAAFPLCFIFLVQMKEPYFPVSWNLITVSLAPCGRAPLQPWSGICENTLSPRTVPRGSQSSGVVTVGLFFRIIIL